jgi:COMPASS component SWD3
MLWSPLSSDAPIAPSPLSGHSNYVYSLAFSPKGNMLVSGSYDEAVFLWDVRSGRCMRQLPAHSDPVRGVDFAADGTMMVSCSTDGLIRIWDSGTGQCLRTLVDEDRKGVTSVCFTPNGRFVCAWTLDECVRLWNYAEGRCVKTYQGHVNKEFSLGGVVGEYVWGDGRDGAFVASGSEDGDVVVWDVSSKELLWRGEGHRDVVLSVDWVRVGERGLLVSVGKDRDVRVWVEDVDEKLLRRRRERAADQEQAARVEELAAGYEVDDDDDDAQIENMEADVQHAQEPNGVSMDVDRNGHAAQGDADVPMN